MSVTNVTLITLVGVGSPVGRPPFKVLPYGAVGEGCGAWEDSDDAASDELDEDFVPMVGIVSALQVWVCTSRTPWRPPQSILVSGPLFPRRLHFYAQRPPQHPFAKRLSETQLLPIPPSILAAILLLFLNRFYASAHQPANTKCAVATKAD
jgi:hypothetical protein